MRQLLKEHTASAHNALDRLVSSFDLSTSAGYEALLAMHARIVPSVEKWLCFTDAFWQIPDANIRLRTNSLIDDMHALHLASPDAINMSLFNDPGSVAGLAYVLEGSRVGAKFISHRVTSEVPSAPVTFIRHGEGFGLWGSFTDWLDRQTWSESAETNACAAADKLFAAYIDSASRQKPSGDVVVHQSEA